MPYTEGNEFSLRIRPKARNDYYSRTIEVVPGYEFSQYETLRTIELYHNSHFTTGNKDELGREKPFYNICKFRVNVAVRATDLDTKDITIAAEDVGAYGQSFVLTLKNRKWMKEADMAQLLNRIGFVRAKFGHVIVKKLERPGELQIHVLPWRDLITDQVDITSGPKIFRHHFTPAELTIEGKKMGWQNIEDAINTASNMEADAVTGRSRPNLTLGDKIQVWEVHGVLPDSYLPGNADKEGADKSYSRQMHVVVLDESDKDEVTGVTLYAGPEDEDPHKDLPWEKVDGRGLGVGVIEDLFEAQVWTNYSAKQKKDMLDLAGKIIFQTTDLNIAARNVLTDLENGSILTTAQNTAITQVNNSAGNYSAINALFEDWDTQAQNVTSTYPAILGSTPPHANAAFRLQASLQNEAAAIFDYRRAEMGLFIQEIYEDWVLPFLVKEINRTKEFIGDMTDDELEVVAGLIAEFETNEKVKDAILSGRVVTQTDMDQLKQAIQQGHIQAGKKRKFKFPKGYFKGDYGVEVITTGEQKDRQKVLSSLFQIFQVVAQNPNVLQNPTMSRLFNEIMETAGVSPALMGAAKTLPAPNAAPGAMPPAPGAPMPGAPVPGSPSGAAIPSPQLAPTPGVAA